MHDLWNWVWVLLAVLFVIELMAGYHKGIYNKDEWLVNSLCGLLGFTVRPLLAGAVALFIGFIFPAGKNALASVPFWVAFPSILLLAEFCGYWMHRFSHRSERRPYFKWLWRLHRTHHTAPYVNVLLHFRVNFAWALVSGLTWSLTAAFYLGQGLAAGLVGLTFALYGVFTHCAIPWDKRIRTHRLFGSWARCLEHVFVSPAIHHTHHGYGRNGASYCNFGIMLSIFDWLFGTLKIPQGRPQHYGLPRAKVHWAEEVFFPLYWRRSDESTRTDKLHN